MLTEQSIEEVKRLEQILDELKDTKYKAFKILDGDVYSKIVYSDDGNERVIFECWDELFCRSIFNDMMLIFVKTDPEIIYRGIYADTVELHGFFKTSDVCLIWCWEGGSEKASLHCGRVFVEVEK